ncbi:MAG: lytic transglycosylase domain-containing protein [Acidobacteriota bacterium]
MLQQSRRNIPQWRGGQEDIRVVCSCQHHSRGRGLWRDAWRTAARGAALLVGLPLVFAAVDITSATPNLGLEPAQAVPAPPSSLRIFTTDTIRDQFLSSTRPMGLEMFKESYFRMNVPFGEIIYSEARKNDLPPELVAAIVHTESDFRPRLISNKSAQGLMQIVPSTARILGVDDPFDPQKNIAAGTRYYRYLLNRFNDETMALAAYNAGEGNVARFGGIPPFAETRDYITKVNRRTRHYRDNFRNSYITSVRVRRGLL